MGSVIHEKVRADSHVFATRNIRRNNAIALKRVDIVSVITELDAIVTVYETSVILCYNARKKSIISRELLYSRPFFPIEFPF